MDLVAEGCVNTLKPFRRKADISLPEQQPGNAQTVTFRSRYDVTEIDGVRVNFENGWGLVRASNTQPALVLRFEATDEAGLSEIRNLFESKLRE
jgi:phosphomannomutase